MTDATPELDTTDSPLARREDGALATTRRKIPVVEGRATRVTLYEDRAEVRRRAVVAAQAGYTWLALSGITPFLDDRSVQVRVLVALPAGDPEEEVENEEIQVATARVVRRLVRPEEYAEAEIAELEAQRDAAREELELATRVVDRIEHRRQRLGALLAEWTAALAEAPRGGGDDALAGWRASYRSLDEALARLNEERHAARAAQLRAREEARQAGARLGARHSEQPRVDTRIEIQLLSNSPAEVEIEVSYRTPCALWRPEHLATISALHDVPLARGGAPASALDLSESDSAVKMMTPLRVQTYATVWQCTGELWDDVELVLSTARPGRAASPPLLREDRVASRRKSHEERQRVVIESHDHVAETTGAAGVRRVDEMPGVDDGGEPLEFRARERVTLASTGEPVRIEVGSVELDAELERVLRPELSSVAHIKASARWEGSYPLLAGPIRVVRGSTLMGRSSQRFVAPGEPFELGMGPDDAIRVRRRVDTERDTTLITGTQLVEVTVDLFLSNLSDATRHVEIVERIPVSQIEGLEVSLRKAIGFKRDEATGMLRCPLQLGPHATEQLSVIFRLKAPSKMVLPF